MFMIITTHKIIIKPAKPNIESAIHKALIDLPLDLLTSYHKTNLHLKQILTYNL